MADHALPLLDRSLAAYEARDLLSQLVLEESELEAIAYHPALSWAAHRAALELVEIRPSLENPDGHVEATLGDMIQELATKAPPILHDVLVLELAGAAEDLELI